MPPHWLRDFRRLIATEPALHAEYLKASSSAETALGDALAERLGTAPHAPGGAVAGRPGDEDAELRARVFAGMVVGAERAAVMHWMRHRRGTLVDIVRAAVRQAVSGLQPASGSQAVSGSQPVSGIGDGK